MQVYDLKKGEELIKAARMSIELYLKSPYFDKDLIKSKLKDFNEHNALFVTLEYYPTKELRGCIGFVSNEYAIKDSIVDAALSAAFQDPRFLPVTLHEINDIIIEVNILSDMIKIDSNKNKQRIKSQIKIGRDGLMIKYGIYSGLLLPSVPVEEKWNTEQFLENTCFKAGINKDYWHYPNVNIYKFQSQIFRESEPNGKVFEIKTFK